MDEKLKVYAFIMGSRQEIEFYVLIVILAVLEMASILGIANDVFSLLASYVILGVVYFVVNKPVNVMHESLLVGWVFKRKIEFHSVVSARFLEGFEKDILYSYIKRYFLATLLSMLSLEASYLMIKGLPNSTFLLIAVSGNIFLIASFFIPTKSIVLASEMLDKGGGWKVFMTLLSLIILLGFEDPLTSMLVFYLGILFLAFFAFPMFRKFHALLRLESGEQVLLYSYEREKIEEMISGIVRNA